ncbi:MAG: DUF4246 domain-containing protein [Akkermansiaceae bacterium]|nr:DUF4246 domain-containing protein [Akkermansiaceae bacterium]
MARSLQDEYIYICVQQLLHLSAQCTDEGVRPSPVNIVFESDTCLDGELRGLVLSALRPLEEVSEEEWDWHPGSSNQVCTSLHYHCHRTVINCHRYLTRRLILTYRHCIKHLSCLACRMLYRQHR